jgi:hypothetical protein
VSDETDVAEGTGAARGPVPGDLGRPVLDDPASLAAGGRPLATVAAELAADIDDVTDAATRRILETIAGYSPTDVVPREDLWWSVRRNVELVLVTLATEALPSESELSVRRELGVRRAEQGLALADLLRAFRVGYLAVWEALTDAAHRQGPDAVAALAEQAALVWGAMDAVSSAVADGYRDRATALDVDHRRRVLALVDALRAGDVPVATERALEAGIDPGAAVHVAACRGVAMGQQHQRPVALLDARAQRDLGRVDAATAGVPTDEPTSVEAAMVDALRTAGATHVGTGPAAAGIATAARALTQAESALRAAVALDVPVLSYAHDWLACTVIDAGDPLQDVLAPVVSHLAADADARATVEAFLAADGNLTRAADRLHLHPNGVAYRVRRLAEQTGVDLRTSAGAREAHVALLLARAGPASR